MSGRDKIWQYRFGNGDIPGTRFLAFKSQRLVSTGIPSLDAVIGGGLPVGTILLVEDDDVGVFGKILINCFAAEGFAHNHSLFVGSNDMSPDLLIADASAGLKEPHAGPPNEDMFNKMSKVNFVDSAFSSEAMIGAKFDSHKGEETLDVNLWPLMENEEGGSYNDLLLTVSKLISDRGYFHDVQPTSSQRNLLRIEIHNIGSSFWPNSQESLPMFFYKLRAVVCNSCSVALVTLPTILLKDLHIVERCEQLSDCVIKFDLLNDSNPLFSEYNGIVSVLKFPSINTLSIYTPDNNEWGVKLRRKKFTIEKLHLPPEIQATAQQEQNDSVSCGEASSNPLEF